MSLGLWVILFIIGILLLPGIGYVLFCLFALFLAFWGQVFKKIDILMCKLLDKIMPEEK